MPSGNQLQKEEKIGVVRAERVRKKVPQFDFLLGILNRVGTVADVAANGERKVTTDSTCNFSAPRILVLEPRSSQNLE